MRKFLILCVAAVMAMCVLPGCRREPEVKQRVLPLYVYMADYKELDSVASWPVPDSLRVAADAFMQIVDYYPVDRNTLYQWSWSLPVRVFTPAVDSVFHSLDGVERQLGGILANAAREGLQFPDREYAAVVWGKSYSIMFADSVMLFALNHYLGEDYPGYTGFPAYQRVNKSPAMLPYDVAEALTATEYAGPGNDCTVLADLLYNGALTEAKMRLVPDAKLWHALGYREEQLKWLDDNERDLWHALLSRNVLFERSLTARNQLTGPAPVTRLLSINSPGRAGRYIGYRLVREYLKRHPGTTLAELLSPDFYNSPDILTEIMYQP